ncbi:SET domain-containing protein [Paramecium bursaria Chlorella virus NW665.2]|nr:SET domain-containing protein [Paramecium bursaria Chlorella virus NW665.2]
MMYNDKLTIGKSKLGGFGMFARKKFLPGEFIDASPCLVKPNDDWGKATEDYLFSRGKLSALPLAGGALFNHSGTPNARHELTGGLKMIRIIAANPINKGDEITISYGPEYFPTRGLKMK